MCYDIDRPPTPLTEQMANMYIGESRRITDPDTLVEYVYVRRADNYWLSAKMTDIDKAVTDNHIDDKEIE